MKIINILILSLLLVLMSSFVSASTQSFPTVSVYGNGATQVITAGNETNSSTYDLGTKWTHTLQSITVTDHSSKVNSSNLSACNESLTLWYGLTSADSSISLTSTETSTQLTDLSSITSNVRYVMLQSKYSYYSNYTNCSTSAVLSYTTGLEDISAGIPSIGSDMGSFLSNLAPGVGAFIIILAILGGVGALLYSIVNVVKSRFNK